MTGVKSIFDRVRKFRCISDLAASILLQSESSYLKRIGWFNSFSKTVPVSKNGNALPWYTYAIISFIESRLKKQMIVFEYGSGNSTVWWAKRVERVVSCEHDKRWYQKMKSNIPSNVTYIHNELQPHGDYSKVTLKYNKEFDIIAIDGRNRVACAMNSISALKDTGVIIWDDSYRDKYQVGYDFLLSKGFKRLDFAGFLPIGIEGSCTSIFYRTKNCFDI